MAWKRSKLGQGEMTADDEIRFAELIEARNNLAEWQSSLANTTEAEMADSSI